MSTSTLIASILGTGIVASSLFAGEASGVPTSGTETNQVAAAADSYSGSASAVCECDDNRCITVTCNVSGEASYEAAKNALEAKIKAKISNEGGRLKGEITFSISADFASFKNVAGRSNIVADPFSLDAGEELEWSGTWIRKVHTPNGGPGLLKVTVTDADGKVVMSRTIRPGSANHTWKPSPSKRLLTVKVKALRKKVDIYVHIEKD